MKREGKMKLSVLLLLLSGCSLAVDPSDNCDRLDAAVAAWAARCKADVEIAYNCDGILWSDMTDDRVDACVAELNALGCSDSPDATCKFSPHRVPW